MPNEPGATTTASDADPIASAGGAQGAVTSTVPDGGAPAGSAWLAVPALIWLALMLRSALVSLRSSGDSALDIAQAAIGLPAVTSAALVGGAAVGLATVRLLDGRLRGGSATRYAVALGAGLLTGVAAAATLVVGHGGGGSVMVFGAVIAAAATIGGALAGTRSGAVVAAGVAASLVVFLLTVARAFFNGELLDLFGAGQNPTSQLAAQQRLTWAASLVGGLVAGLVAAGYLRWVARDTPGLRWQAYQVAGGSVGAMLLITEVITRIGGAGVLESARSVSASDNLFQNMAAMSRINSALVVLFVGALTAMIAYGRTLRPAPERGGDDEVQDPV